eukprot:Rmarinus@m.14365
MERIISALTKRVKCSRCKKPFNNNSRAPRLLPCAGRSHTLCTSCIAALTKVDNAECPICNSPIGEDRSSVKDFMINDALVQVIEVLHEENKEVADVENRVLDNADAVSEALKGLQSKDLSKCESAARKLLTINDLQQSKVLASGVVSELVHLLRRLSPADPNRSVPPVLLKSLDSLSSKPIPSDPATDTVGNLHANTLVSPLKSPSRTMPVCSASGVTAEIFPSICQETLSELEPLANPTLERIGDDALALGSVTDGRMKDSGVSCDATEIVVSTSQGQVLHDGGPQEGVQTDASQICRSAQYGYAALTASEEPIVDGSDCKSSMLGNDTGGDSGNADEVMSDDDVEPGGTCLRDGAGALGRDTDDLMDDKVSVTEASTADARDGVPMDTPLSWSQAQDNLNASIATAQENDPSLDVGAICVAPTPDAPLAGDQSCRRAASAAGTPAATVVVDEQKATVQVAAVEALTAIVSSGSISDVRAMVAHPDFLTVLTPLLLSPHTAVHQACVTAFFNLANNPAALSTIVSHSGVMSAFCYLLDSKDINTVTRNHVLRILSKVAPGSVDACDRLIKLGGVKQIIQLFSDGDPKTILKELPQLTGQLVQKDVVRQAFVTAGALPLLGKLLTAPDEKVRLESCRVVNEFAQYGDTVKAAYDACIDSEFWLDGSLKDLSPTLVASLAANAPDLDELSAFSKLKFLSKLVEKLYADQTSTRVATARAIDALARSDDIRQKLRSNTNSIPMLLKCVSKGDSQPLKEKAATTLAILFQDGLVNNLKIKPSPALVSALRHLRVDNPAMLVPVTKFLEELSSIKTYCADIASFWLPRLTSMLELGAEHDAVRENALAVLHNVSLSGSSHSYLAERALTPLVGLLKSSNRTLQAGATLILGNLCHSERLQQKIAKAGAIAPLADLLSQKTPKAFTENSLSILLKLAENQDTAPELVSEGALNPLYSLLETATEPSSLVTAAMAIKAVAKNDSLRESLLESGVVSHCLPLLRRDSAGPVQDEVLGIMLNLAESEKLKGTLVSAGVVDEAAPLLQSESFISRSLATTLVTHLEPDRCVSVSSSISPVHYIFDGDDGSASGDSGPRDDVSSEESEYACTVGEEDLAVETPNTDRLMVTVDLTKGSGRMLTVAPSVTNRDHANRNENENDVDDFQDSCTASALSDKEEPQSVTGGDCSNSHTSGSGGSRGEPDGRGFGNAVKSGEDDSRIGEFSSRKDDYGHEGIQESSAKQGVVPTPKDGHDGPCRKRKRSFSENESDLSDSSSGHSRSEDSMSCSGFITPIHLDDSEEDSIGNCELNISLADNSGRSSRCSEDHSAPSAGCDGIGSSGISGVSRVRGNDGLGVSGDRLGDGCGSNACGDGGSGSTGLVGGGGSEGDGDVGDDGARDSGELGSAGGRGDENGGGGSGDVSKSIGSDNGENYGDGGGSGSSGENSGDGGGGEGGDGIESAVVPGNSARSGDIGTHGIGNDGLGGDGESSDGNGTGSSRGSGCGDTKVSSSNANDGVRGTTDITEFGHSDDALGKCDDESGRMDANRTDGDFDSDGGKSSNGHEARNSGEPMTSDDSESDDERSLRTERRGNACERDAYAPSSPIGLRTRSKRRKLS